MVLPNRGPSHLRIPKGQLAWVSLINLRRQYRGNAYDQQVKLPTFPDRMCDRSIGVTDFRAMAEIVVVLSWWTKSSGRYTAETPASNANNYWQARAFSISTARGKSRLFSR